uniref:Interleukin 13 receptor, alpha 1 n=1 Tax=Amphiprion percula TaxID=161767 RepID=A0A3P8TIY8_AMPPE
MTVNAAFWGFFGTAMLMVFHSEADHRLPALKNLSYTWVDPFTLNLSWSWDKPKHLPDSCTINYEIHYPDKSEVRQVRTPNHHYEISFLTEQLESNEGSFSIHALTELLAESCAGWKKSKSENISISTQKPIVDVVKDFKCSIASSQTNCSWEPVSPSVDLKISYRICGIREENSLKKCHQFYRDGIRTGCLLQNDGQENNICVLAQNAAGLQTFQAKRVIPLPKLNIRKDEDYLNLEWTSPDIGKACQLKYVVCYSECNRDKGCLEYRSVLNTLKHGPLPILYNKNCRYEFKFNATLEKYCPTIPSDSIAVECYGNNTDSIQPSDGTLTVVAIVIPVILSVGVILSCYCFRRHRAILCPTMPDPSTIFKEMMNGNKEQKTISESLYTPVPEPIEPITITPVSENSVFQQKS